MAALKSLIPELEDVLSHGSAAKRTKTLERITDLFLEDAGRYDEKQVGLFDDVLGMLIVEIETKTLAAIARRLAPVPNAPATVIKRLAHDDHISVAGPVLMRSERLGESDLVDIAKTKGQEYLLAISGRAKVTPAVTNVLIGRGDPDVVRNVVRNPGARFSEAGFAVLTKRAEKDEALAAGVGERPDVPPRLFRALLAHATEVVRKRLLAAAGPEKQAEIRRILSEIAREIGAKAPPSHDYWPAQCKVLALRQGGGLGEPELAEFAKSGQYDETLVALSTLCALPVDVADRLLSGDRADPVLILCKASGFRWPTARAIITALAHGRRVSSQALDGAQANFDRLSPVTARRVLRFWQTRPDNADIAAE